LEVVERCEPEETAVYVGGVPCRRGPPAPLAARGQAV